MFSKWNKGQKAKLCFNCFLKEHLAQGCPSSERGKVCMKRHSSPLHFGSNEQQVTANLADHSGIRLVLLSTAVVKIPKLDRSFMQVRPLVDQSSKCSFITEAIVQKCWLNKQ